MSQKSQVDGAQKHFAVGRGLLAAAETLNFSMNEQRSGRQMGGSGGGVGGMEGQDGGSQMSRRPSPLGSTMKLFASLGLSPSDLDALAEIPEEDISVETLPRILMQLKSRKGDAAERRAVSSMSSDAAYRGGRDAWDDMGRMGGPSLGQASARGQNSADFGFGSQQDAAPGHSFGMNFNNGGGRERSYSDLSHRDSYGGLGMGSSSSSSNPVFMQRRMGSPSVGKVQDFLGVTPTMFPHVCSLCDFDVHSTLEWNQHVNGLKHAENCRLLVNMYPDWDPGMSTGRSGTHLDNLNLSAGLLGPAPMSSVQGGGGATSSWGGGGGSGGNDPGPSQLRSRVVVVKYDRKPLSNKTLFAFTEPFGRLQEHLVLKNKAFLEMSSHEEAQDMVNYYQQHPASLYGKRISFYVSQRLLVIEKDERAADRPMDRMMDRPMDRMMDRPMDRPMDRMMDRPMDRMMDRPMDRMMDRPMDRMMDRPMDRPMDRMMDRPMDRMMDRPMDRMMDRPMDRMMDRPMDRMMDRPMDRPMERGSKEPSRVVFFSNLPREDDNKTVLLTIAGRFGVVEKHLFLTDQAFVQLRNPNDAEMLVKYYTMNPLTIKGRLIRLNVCTKYKTLNVNWRQGGAAGDRNQRTRGASTSSGSGARSSSRTSSSSRSRGEKKEEKSEAEEEVSVVIEEVMEEQATDGDPKEEEQTRVEATKEVVERPEEVQEEEEEQGPGDDLVAEEAPGDVGVAEGERHQGAESEGPTERPGAAEEEEKEGNEEAPTDPGESSEVVEGDLSADMSDQDFLENMEDFVTLDELAEEEEEAEGASSSHDISRKGVRSGGFVLDQQGLRVINIIGFRRGYNYLNELLGLAKPFGKVVKHLVLDLRPEAYFQFETEEEARAMAKFYSSNVTASVCGRPVRISHSMTYPTIQCGSSKVVYIGLLPSTKYSDEDVLKLAEPFGPVRKYFTNRIKRECFIEMEEAEDAEKMADHCKANPPKLHGKRLTSIYVSRKYRQLKHGHRCPSTAKRESRSSSPKPSEEPPAKKVKREEQEEEKEEQEEEEEQQQEEEKEEEEQQQQKEEQVQSSDQENSAEKTPQVCEELHSAVEEEQQLKEEHKEEQQKELKEQQKEEQQKEHKEEQEEVLISRTEQAASPPPPAPAAEPRPLVAASLPLPPYDASSPIGVEHVKMGFYCRICFLFYSNEDTAKKTHCSSQSHYDKLQKHLEKEQTKAEKKKGRKTAA